MLEVEIIRSDRRKKTAQARLIDGVVVIRVPSRMPAKEVDKMVVHFRSLYERRRDAAEFDLVDRAARLAKRHDLPVPESIRWVSNQRHRWGSCTPADRVVRLSDRMSGFPDWVVDYVIVHELAHLVEPNHSPAFWRLVGRYPLTERARGYLIAKGGED